MRAPSTTRSALGVLALAYFFSFASGGIQLPLTSMAMQSVGLSMSTVGLMWAARSVLQVFGPTLWGVLADRRGDARPFGVIALFSGAALLIALAFTTTPWIAILIFGLYGLLCGPAGSIIDGMVITALDDKTKYGRWRAWGTIGFGVTALASSLLVDRNMLAPVPITLFPLCALLTAIGGVAIVFVPRLARPSLSRMRDLGPLLRRKDMVALFFTSMILWCSHAAYSSFLTPLALDVGLPEWSVGASLAAAIVVEAVMLREAGVFVTRFGARNVLVFASALAVVRWALCAVTTSPIAFIALHALHGVTFGLFFGTLVGVIAAKAPPEMRQAAQGAIGASSFGLGGAIGSLVVGVVLEHFGPATTWWTMSAIALCGFVLAWRTIR